MTNLNGPYDDEVEEPSVAHKLILLPVEPVDLRLTNLKPSF